MKTNFSKILLGSLGTFLILPSLTFMPAAQAEESVPGALNLTQNELRVSPLIDEWTNALPATSNADKYKGNFNLDGSSNLESEQNNLENRVIDFRQQQQPQERIAPQRGQSR